MPKGQHEMSSKNLLCRLCILVPLSYLSSLTHRLPIHGEPKIVLLETRITSQFTYFKVPNLSQLSVNYPNREVSCLLEHPDFSCLFSASNRTKETQLQYKISSSLLIGQADICFFHWLNKLPQPFQKTMIKRQKPRIKATIKQLRPPAHDFGVSREVRSFSFTSLTN